MYYMYTSSYNLNTSHKHYMTPLLSMLLLLVDDIASPQGSKAQILHNMEVLLLQNISYQTECKNTNTGKHDQYKLILYLPCFFCIDPIIICIMAV